MILLIFSLKLSSESIVIPCSVTDETDFVIILLISSLCEPVFQRRINLIFSGIAFTELYTNHLYTFARYV